MIEIMVKVLIVLLCYLLSAPALIVSIISWMLFPLIPIALIFHFILCLHWIFESTINKMFIRITIFCIILSYLSMPILASISAKKFNFDDFLIFIFVEIFSTLPFLFLMSYIIEKNLEAKNKQLFKNTF